MKKDVILILCPMDCEGNLLVSSLEEKREEQIAGYIFFEGRIKNIDADIVIVRSLMGTVNAAVCTMLALERYSVRCVILQGTAGAHNPDLKMNDIVVAKKILPFDGFVSGHLASGEGTNPLSWEILGLQTYSQKEGKLYFARYFECDETLVNIAMSVPYGEGKVICGTVASGNVWNKEQDLILHYHETKGTDCEEMEGTGVAQICMAFSVPMIEIRVISNSEFNKDEHFSKNTAVNVQKFVLEYLRKISNNFAITDKKS